MKPWGAQLPVFDLFITLLRRNHSKIMELEPVHKAVICCDPGNSNALDTTIGSRLWTTYVHRISQHAPAMQFSCDVLCDSFILKIWSQQFSYMQVNWKVVKLLLRKADAGVDYFDLILSSNIECMYLKEAGKSQ